MFSGSEIGCFFHLLARASAAGMLVFWISPFQAYAVTQTSCTNTVYFVCMLETTKIFVFSYYLSFFTPPG